MNRVFPNPDPMPVHFSISFLDNVKDRPGSDKANKLPLRRPIKLLEGMYYSAKSGEVRGSSAMEDLVKGTLGNSALFRDFPDTDPHLGLHYMVECTHEFLVGYQCGAHEAVNRITKHHGLYTDGIIEIDI